LRSGKHPFVLVTGDSPANPPVLSEALGNVAGPGYAVTIIPCGPELRHEDLETTVPTLTKPKVTSGTAAEPGCSASVSPLFVFDDFDRLSDRQIEAVCKGTLFRDQMQGAAVLLAPLDFVVRLERPALRFLKDRIAAQFGSRRSATRKPLPSFTISPSHSGIAGLRRAGFATASWSV
jgi:hypothetical protein